MTLLEPCERWRKQARRYLGNKRAQRCAFEGGRLEAYAPPRGVLFDLVWVQWTLQYLIDADVVAALRALAAALAPNGLLIVKENRPVAPGKEQLVQVDVPDGPHGRHDVLRPDGHHRHLFACAALEVERWEHWGECTAWVLRPSAEPPRVLQPSLARQDGAAASVGVVASIQNAGMVAIRRAALDAEMRAAVMADLGRRRRLRSDCLRSSERRGASGDAASTRAEGSANLPPGPDSHYRQTVDPDGLERCTRARSWPTSTRTAGAHAPRGTRLRPAGAPVRDGQLALSRACTRAAADDATTDYDEERWRLSLHVPVSLTDHGERRCATRWVRSSTTMRRVAE